MALSQTQISAYISPTTRQMMDRYTRSTGIKKGFLIESALLHHLQALQALPADVIIPPELVVTGESAQLIIDMLEHPPEPTKAMKALFDQQVSVDMLIDHD